MRPRVGARRPPRWQRRFRRAPVRSRLAASGGAPPSARSSSQAPPGPLWGLGEVWAAPLLVGIAPLLSLLAHVEEESRIVGELLDPGDPVLVRIEARLQQSQRQWGERRHLAAPGDRLALEPVERNDRVDQAH